MDRKQRASNRWGPAAAAVVATLLVLAALPLSGGLAAPGSAPELTPTATLTPSASPPPVQTIDIANATPVACGQAIAGTTTGAANNVSAYGCVPWWPETGPEQVFSLSLAASSDVDALLNGLASDLDLFLLTGASAASCIAYGDNAVRIDGLAAGTYYLVVDGFDGAAGAFQLNVWCPLEVTPSPSPTATATMTPRPILRRVYLPLLLDSTGEQR